jgi:hypothetical protein
MPSTNSSRRTEMTFFFYVAEWIEKLKEFPQDQEVRITDGHKYHFYEGDFNFQLFEDVDGSTFQDIGIGQEELK